MLSPTRTHIKLAPRFLKQLTHLGHARLDFARHKLFGFLDRDKVLGGLVLLRRKLAHFLADLHRAEFRPAHTAEMRRLCALRGERLVVILFGGVGVEAQVELVAPAEFEARFR